MSCLDNIVTLGLCPDDGQSLSGYTLIQAAGMSQKNFAGIATETYVKGVDMVMEKKSLALRSVSNDFLTALQVNGMLVQMFNPDYGISEFNPANVIPASSLQRGVTIHKANYRRNSLKKVVIKAVQCYPFTSGQGTLKIIDGNKTLSWPVTFVAGQINTFDSSNLSGFDYVVTSKEARIVFDAPDISFASSIITCLLGCNNTEPNECAWADGWDGNKAVKAEGFGMNIIFGCECNYDQVLCDMSKSFSGELIWLKWQILVYEEQYKSNRLSNWVIYNRDEIMDVIIPDLQNRYNTRWNALMAGLQNIVKTYGSDCIICNRMRWAVNM